MSQILYDFIALKYLVGNITKLEETAICQTHKRMGLNCDYDKECYLTPHPNGTLWLRYCDLQKKLKNIANIQENLIRNHKRQVYV